MKTSRIFYAFAILLIMSPAFAISLEHKASLSSCPLTKRVHGECHSTSEASFLNGTSSIDINCRLSRNGLPVSSRVQSVSATGSATSFKTTLHTTLKTNVEFCAENRSKYHSNSWPLYPIYVGQKTSKMCEWVQGSGVDN